MDIKNHQHQQLRTSLSELVDTTELQSKMNSLNSQWKQVREGAELHLNNLDECQQLLKANEESYNKLQEYINNFDGDQVKCILIKIVFVQIWLLLLLT